MKNFLTITAGLFLMMSNIFSQQISFEDEMDSLFSKYEKPNPGAAVEIVSNGKIIFSKGYGFANIEENIPINSETNFRLASVTKQFTATAILILIQKGKLNFDDKLTDLFPGFPEYGKNITIKNLLNHTSGLIDYENEIPDSVSVQVTDNDALQSMMKLDSTYFIPGTKWQYSNTGYALLALIVEKISGKTFPVFLEENIFSPLKMTSTIAHIEGKEKIKNRAYGYDSTASGWIRHDQSITSAVLGDGGIYSNLSDLYNWDQALFTSKILSDSLRTKSMTRGKLIGGEEIDYGFGWRLTNYKDNGVVYHTGSTQGFRNIIYRIPDKKFTVIILTNRNSAGEFVTKGIAEKVVDIYLKRRY